MRAKRSGRLIVVVLLLLGQPLLGGIAYAPPQAEIRCVDWCNPDNPGPPVPVPDPGCASANISALQATVVISGVIINPRGLPISGACVYWVDGSSYATAPTSSTGAYAITVLADRPVTLIANHEIFQWEDKSIANPVLASTSPQNFTLLYLLTTRVTPNVFNNTPQKTLTFETYSTVPVVGSRVIVQLPGGSFIELQHDLTYTDPGGWARWTGTWTVLAGTPDAVYTYYSCALDSGATGSCQAPGGLILSQLKDQLFVVDSVPPVIRSPVPTPNHNTLLRRPSISVLVSDSLSGIAQTSLTLVLDGANVPASFNTTTGKLSFTPSVDLALGIHTVTATASDLAGNGAANVWKFNVISSSAVPGIARLDPPVVIVFGPGTEQVTFPSIPAAVGDTRFILSSSVSPGWGSAAVSVPLSQARVTFRQGPLSTTVDPQLSPKSFAQDFVVLAPSSRVLRIRIKGRSLEVGPVSVSVPAEYRLTGGEAAFTLADTTVAPVIPYPNPTPNSVSCTALVLCRVSGIVECVFNSAKVDACDGTNSDVYLRATGQTNRVVAANDDLNSGSKTYPKLPNFYCGQTNCSDLLNGGVHRSDWVANEPYLATDGYLFRAFGNHYYYGMVGGALTGSLVSSWQESDAQPGATSCISGSPARITAKLKEFGNSVEPLSSSGSLAISRRAYTDGASGGASQDVVLPPSEVADTSPPQIYKVWQTANLASGTFGQGAGQAYGFEGLKATSNAAFNNWKPGSETSIAELMTGTEYSSGTGSAYSLRAAIFFDFQYDNGAC